MESVAANALFLIAHGTRIQAVVFQGLQGDATGAFRWQFA